MINEIISAPWLPIQPRQSPRAVAEDVNAGVYSIEHGEPEIGQRCFRLCGKAEMAAGFQGAAATAGEENGQVVVRVGIAIGDAAAVGDHAMIEQGSVAFGHGFEPLE